MSKKTVTRIVYTALAVGGAWLCFQFLLPWTAPFLLALFTARLMEPWVKRLMGAAKLKRGFAAAVCGTLILAVLIGALALIVSQLTGAIAAFIRNLPDMAGRLSHTFGKLENAVYRFVIAAPVETQAMIKSAISSFSSTLEALPGELSAALLSLAGSIAAAFPKIMLFAVTYSISVLFMSAGYPQIRSFILRQVPPSWHERVQALKGDTRRTVAGWCKAQLMLMALTFGELSLALLILRVPHAVLAAALIALVDALPVFGTGTVLIPWGVLSILGENGTLGVGLLLTYCIVSLVRSFVEPRFVGGQLGLHPVATLMAMYVGFCAMGVPGMLLFPLVLMLLQQFNDRGYIRLWK